MFVDEVDIHVTAGAGGNGCLSFRREKFVPRGGPDGGDGGQGGSIHLVASPHQNTLVNFRFHPEFTAERGRHGEGAKRTGRSGADLDLEVPPGTVVFETLPDGSVRPIADLTAVGDRVLVARGGRGGRGNARFASSTNQAPRRTEPGEAGESRRLRLRLKLIADAALVGFPNAGKSTLIARVSAARPKIADYPFTTLVPNLGVVSLDEDRSFVLADVPGLIEGAHEGHGLGTRFLSHIERTRVIVEMVDVSSASGRDPVDDLETLERELALYRPDPPDPAFEPLDTRPVIVAASRIDAMDDPARRDRLAAAVAERGLPFHEISGVTGAGVRPLLEAIWTIVDRRRAETLAGADPA